MTTSGSPAKPWERNRGNGGSASNLRTESTIEGGTPSLPSRAGLGNGVAARGSPYSGYSGGGGMGSSMYGGSNSLYGGSYGSAYGSSYGGMGSSMYGGGYGSRYGGMGSSMYGGLGGRYSGSSMYGSSYGGMGSSLYGGGGYGSRYGSSMYGGLGGGYGSTYSRYGSGYDDASYRNPYPRGKYWSYGEEDEFGNPVGDPADNGSILMDMENVVEGFGHFTRILDYNFETIHCSFASVLRLFDSMGELRRAIYYGLQGLAVFTILGKCFRYLQKIIYRLLGKPIPESLSSSSTKQLKDSLDSFEDQWSGNRPQGKMTKKRASKRSSRALLLLLGFFALILGGPMLFSAIYRAIVGPRASSHRRPRNKPQAKALYDFNGEAEGDLPFKKGDIISIRRQVGEGWLEGELSNGQVGIVPESYIAPLNQRPQPGNPPNVLSPPMRGEMPPW